jgi:hypothetical protein
VPQKVLKYFFPLIFKTGGIPKKSNVKNNEGKPIKIENNLYIYIFILIIN